MTGRRVAVVGGGVIGLSCAWSVAERGHEVVVYDDPSRPAAAGVAAGMLTPVTEAYWGEEGLLALSVASMRSWPDFARRLTEASAQDLALRLDGVLAVGLDADDLAVVDDLHGLQDRVGLDSTRLRGSACRAHEPLLVPSVRGGVLAEGEGSVDPRRVLTALRTATRRAGVRLVDHRVERPDPDELDVDRVVLAAGSWSPHPVRPVFGEVVRVRQPEADLVPARVVRGLVHGRAVYVVPRPPDDDGTEIVLGATSLEVGFRPTPTAGGAYELLRDAIRLLPALAEAELVEVRSGLRPGTPDNAPLIGRSPSDPRVVQATGHYRNGVLLAPVTAAAVAALLDDEAPAVDLEPADPGRFVREPVT